MKKCYITIAEVQYYTTIEQIKKIALLGGFSEVKFIQENISGRFRKGYYNAIFKHDFKNMLEKVRASRIVRNELNKLKVV